MTPQELKAYIERLDPKTNKALIEALTEEYNNLVGIKVVEVAQTEPEPATAPAAKAAVAATADEVVTTSEPEQTKATAEAKAAVETGATAADQKPAVAVDTASAGDTEAIGTAPREVATASTTYELSESVKQIIKEFEETGDDGGYPKSAYYIVTEEVLKRYCRDNGIDYNELMTNNQVVKTQSFTQAN